MHIINYQIQYRLTELNKMSTLRDVFIADGLCLPDTAQSDTPLASYSSYVKYLIFVFSSNEHSTLLLYRVLRTALFLKNNSLTSLTFLAFLFSSLCPFQYFIFDLVHFFHVIITPFYNFQQSFIRPGKDDLLTFDLVK